MAFLKVYTGGDEKTVFLGEDPVVLGRGQDTDVLLKDVKVSRRHCVIESLGDDQWCVRDLGSGNGTKVNGEAVEIRILKPDDVVEVGDAKIIFAGEAVKVVLKPGAPEAPRRAPRRTPSSEGPPAPRRGGSRPALVLAGVVAIGGLVLLLALRSLDSSRPTDNAAEVSAYRAVESARTDEETVDLGEAYLTRFPGSVHADRVATAMAQARQRLGKSAARRAAPPPGEDKDQRASFFAELQQVFHRHVDEMEYARAREIWFFLHEDKDWTPIPPTYRDRIVEAMLGLENAASIERGDLFEEVARAESAHDFQGARELLTRALPRFTGTSVLRSLEEKIEFLDRAIKHGVRGQPTRAPTRVRVDVEKQVTALLARMKNRGFAAVAKEMRALAEKSREERGYPELDARARECEAAAALHRKLAGALARDFLPRGQVLRRYRVRAGGRKGVTVTSRGKELTWSWAEVPAELYLALLEKQAEKDPLGLVVAAHFIAPDAAFVAVVGRVFQRERMQGPIQEFLARVVRNEPLPAGGYVVNAGEIVTRKEFLRRREEALIKSMVAQLDEAHSTVKNAGIFKRVARLKKKKDQLDEARAYALELIFDQKKYFYPYRGTGRMGEYNKVQQEVDARVAAVREIWEDKTTVSVKKSPGLTRALELFDEGAAELEKRLVDIEEKRDEVTFLRSYLGQKFTVRSLYRTPEEFELLRYGNEVMEDNAALKGDITDVEREQVRITNEYRMMFGRWPVRLVDKLVLSARGHSEEMSRLGYFGHFSPTPGRRTTYDRMKLAGYDYGSSENIIMGRTGPMAAHVGWCHSSGHHRNILTKPWTDMGTGHYGRYMTQNYGAGPKRSKYDEPREKLEPWDEPWAEDGCGEGGGDEEYDYDKDDG